MTTKIDPFGSFDIVGPFVLFALEEPVRDRAIGTVRELLARFPLYPEVEL